MIMLLPVPGTLFLAWTKTNIGYRSKQKMINNIIEETKTIIPQDKAVINDDSVTASGMDDLCRYINTSGCFPIYTNTEVKYFPLGEDKFAAMLEELEKAEKYIYLEFFIIEEGTMWGQILNVLMRKADAGLDVRVMYDGMCEMFWLPHAYWKLLCEHGIQAQPFAPIRPVVSSQYNYRDHRKILVIDGKVAFTGGVNLADEYINRVQRFGHWKDTSIMLKGSAAKSFTLMFLQLWNTDEGMPLALPAETEAHPSSVSDGYVIPYCDCPLDADKVGETVYMDILYRATDYVHIMTPYLILDGEMETALKYAAQRGVDVTLILPGIPDKKMASALAKNHYRSLIASGVRIYEYTPGFIHAKVFVSDDKKAVVGSINLDYRSLYHHFECAAYLFKTACIPEIEADFQSTLAKCAPVTEETLAREKLSVRVLGHILKFIAPLM